MMRFTWRNDKALINRRKHGLGFELATGVFAYPFARTLWDRVVDGEERWRTLGFIVSGRTFRLLVVIHTCPDPDDETLVHVISLRDATRHERRDYEICNI